MDHRTHERGVGMLNTPYVKKDTIKNFSPFPTQSLIWDCTTWRSTSTPICSALRIDEPTSALSAIPPSQGSWVSRSTPWQSMLPRWRSMGSSEQSARRSSPGTVSSATAVSGTPSCRSRMPSPSVMSVSWRKRRKPWNGSGHRQGPKSWAPHSLRQRESRARKTAKYALLTRGRAGFWEHAARSEGSDTTPVSLMRNLLLFGREDRGINRPAAAGIKRKLRARDTRPGVLWQCKAQPEGRDTSPSQPYQFYPSKAAVRSFRGGGGVPAPRTGIGTCLPRLSPQLREDEPEICLFDKGTR